MGKVECPICGEKFDDEYVEFLDNGNPACPNCVAHERELDKTDDSNRQD